MNFDDLKLTGKMFSSDLVHGWTVSHLVQNSESAVLTYQRALVDEDNGDVIKDQTAIFTVVNDNRITQELWQNVIEPMILEQLEFDWNPHGNDFYVVDYMIKLDNEGCVHYDMQCF